MIKKLLCLLLLISFFVGTAHAQTSPSPEFLTEYDLIYRINAQGITEIEQKIKIINNQNDIIPTKYTQTIKQMEIYDIEVDDEDKNITIDAENGSTNITTEFKKASIGLGKDTEINIRYKTKDIASKVGEIWNINVPRIEMSDATRKYEVRLETPKAFGPNIYTAPSPLKSEETPDTLIYLFDTSAYNNTGITASFGKYQTVNYKLNYKLENATNFSNTQEVALPPDIVNRQEIIYEKLTPQPLDLRVDKDGNYLAAFKVPPKTILNVELIGSAKISGKQIQPEYGGKVNEVPEEIRNNYTKADKYWEINSPEIKKVSVELFDSRATVSENALFIYNYIVGNLKYDFSITDKEFIERHGALKAIQNQGKWACMEFTDLFIALARANGIPARELNGYAFSGEGVNTPLSINLRGGDVLHAWPEFYDPNFGWVAIDPTWGSTSGVDYFTKLDTSHFVFVVKGINSEFPLPAGSYKVTGNEKQVEVDIASNGKQGYVENIKLYKTISFNPLDYFDNKTTYILSNEGKISVFNVNEQVFVVPPYEAVKIKLQKESNMLTYEYFNGEKKVANPEVLAGTPSTYNATESTLAILFGAALVLCMSVYLTIVRLKVRNRSLHPLRLRHRDPDL